jgi:uncharacterized protein with NRDE domain
MCLIAFAYRKHASARLIVISNRDEFYQRPTRALEWWSDAPILAGRDLQAGGTWIGMSKNGHFGAVTNYRDGTNEETGKTLSRGHLVSSFLSSRQSAAEWAESLGPAMADYGGFNLLIGDSEDMFYLNNYQQDQPQRLQPGVYALSNHLLDSPWPKVEYARQRMHKIVEGHEVIGKSQVPQLLADFSLQSPYPDHLLPDTGISREWERILSSPFISTPTYGTRASSAIIISADGEIYMRERGFSTGQMLHDAEFQFTTG